MAKRGERVRGAAAAKRLSSATQSAGEGLRSRLLAIRDWCKLATAARARRRGNGPLLDFPGFVGWNPPDGFDAGQWLRPLMVLRERLGSIENEGPGDLNARSRALREALLESGFIEPRVTKREEVALAWVWLLMDGELPDVALRRVAEMFAASLSATRKAIDRYFGEDHIFLGPPVPIPRLDDD